MKSIPKLCFSLLLFQSLLLTAQERKTITVPYNNYGIHIDGDDKEWEDVAYNKFRTTSKFTPDPNMCYLKVAWDENYFYVTIRIVDHILIGLEKPDQVKRLHYNDSFELYIDSQNDSKDTIDLNDYQFTIELNGGHAVFRGDRLSLKLKHIVPKAAGTANIVFKSATTIIGSVNNNSDRDSCYVVECKVPWAGIGIDPVKGLKLKADFCINDNDTLIDFRKLPLGPIKNYTNTTMLGYRDFGFPAHWPQLILEGEPSLYKRLTDRYAKDWVYFLFFSIASIALAIAVFFFKIKRLHQIPERGAENPSPLVSFVVNPQEPIKPDEPLHPLLLKARAYILKNLDQQIKTEDLASELALSVRQLQRIFQVELNTTPKAFIITVKLEVAAELLKLPGKNITEVAYSIGFTDPSYFARVFKKYFDLSPSDFQAK